MELKRLAFKEVLHEARRRFRALDLEQLRRLGVWQDAEKYYLIGTYPPLKAMHDLESDVFLKEATASCNTYVHIPFCEQRCSFCHFAKEILPPEERVRRYLETLRLDIQYTASLTGHPEASTIYFGGGTPSYLNPKQIMGIFKELRQNLHVEAGTETTFELHPSLVDLPDYTDRLDAMQESGVNRWVFGIQSMNDAVLKKLNRGHTAAGVHALLELLADRNVTNFSVDLIFGLPYQTVENWYSSIIELLNAGVEKFNIFPLMFKQADPITAHYRRNPEIFPDNETRLLMHFMTEVIVESESFMRGPIFYYAKDRHHSLQQESKYDRIEEVNLLPFGVSGFGFVGRTQYYNHCTIDDYASAVNTGRAPIWKGWTLDLDERMRRAVMFPLRSGGVNRSNFAATFDHDPVDLFGAQLQPYIDNGLISVDEEAIHVTDVGAPFADSIAISLASNHVRERVQESNGRRVNLKTDLLDMHDYSPLERDAVAADVTRNRNEEPTVP
jgi:coproporphyrinogen III oxidase-like Fe-S oxidoreductase